MLFRDIFSKTPADSSFGAPASLAIFASLRLSISMTLPLFLSVWQFYEARNEAP